MLNCERVLTSGQQASAPEGATLIRALVEEWNKWIVLVPGAGITADNIVELAKLTGTRAFHASAKRCMPSGMHHQQVLLKDMQEGELRSEKGQILAIAERLR